MHRAYNSDKAKQGNRNQQRGQRLVLCFSLLLRIIRCAVLLIYQSFLFLRLVPVPIYVCVLFFCIRPLHPFSFGLPSVSVLPDIWWSSPDPPLLRSICFWPISRHYSSPLCCFHRFSYSFASASLYSFYDLLGFFASICNPTNISEPITPKIPITLIILSMLIASCPLIDTHLGIKDTYNINHQNQLLDFFNLAFKYGVGNCNY